MSVKNQKKKLRLIFCCRSFFFALFFFSYYYPISAYQIITELEISGIIQKKYQSDTIIIDVRNPLYYESGHIPGSLNFTVKKSLINKIKIIADKNKAIILYCSNRLCPESENAAKVIEKHGYFKTFVFKEGFDEWKRKGYPVESGKIADYDSMTVQKITPGELDRQMDEFYIIDLNLNSKKNGKIKGAITIPADDLFEKYNKIPDKKKNSTLL